MTDARDGRCDDCGRCRECGSNRGHLDGCQWRKVLRSYRAPDGVYDAAMARAHERGENLSDVIRTALEQYAHTDH